MVSKAFAERRLSQRLKPCRTHRIHRNELKTELQQRLQVGGGKERLEAKLLLEKLKSGGKGPELTSLEPGIFDKEKKKGK